MSLKSHLARRYVPSSTKWKLVLKGVGKLYRAIFDELEKDHGSRASTKLLANAAFNVGLDFGRDLKEALRLGSEIRDIEVAMDIEHKIFGIKVTTKERTEGKVVYHCHDCAWQKYFTPKLCIAIGQAEKGIAQALNPKAKYHIFQTRTMGKEHCAFEVKI